jgi:hypothetical protein
MQNCVRLSAVSPNLAPSLTPAEEPSEVLASWNAANAFSGDGWREALSFVLQQQAGATYVAEFMKRGTGSADKNAFHARMAEIQEALHGTGYAIHIQDMTPDVAARNVHWQAVIARDDPNISVARGVFGERRGFIVNLGQVATRATLLHAPDDSAAKRLKTAHAVRRGYDRTNGAAVGYQQHLSTQGHEHDGIVVGGDLNAMAEDDPGAKLPRAIYRGIGGLLIRALEGRDLYDTSKRLQRLGGKILRIASMPDQSLAALRELHDVDPAHVPTIHQQIFNFHIDHFMVNDNVGVVPGSYQVREPRANGGARLSDHDLIRMAIRHATPPLAGIAR